MSTHAIDRPYDRLQPLPRGLWLPSLVNSSGERAQRLGDVAVWLQALTAGELPPAAADFGDEAATPPLREAVGAGLTRGNLSSHLSRLEMAGYVEVVKTYRGRVPLTLVAMSDAGRAAFDEYRSRLRSIAAGLPE